MATPDDIFSGFKTTLEAGISGLRVHKTIPDDPHPPCAVVQYEAVDFSQAGKRGVNVFTFTVTVYVQHADTRSAQEEIYDYMPGGSKSLRDAIFDTPGLGVAGLSAFCSGASALTVVEVPGRQLLGLPFTVQVSAQGD